MCNAEPCTPYVKPRRREKNTAPQLCFRVHLVPLGLALQSVLGTPLGFSRPFWSCVRASWILSCGRGAYGLPSRTVDAVRLAYRSVSLLSWLWRGDPEFHRGYEDQTNYMLPRQPSVMSELTGAQYKQGECGEGRNRAGHVVRRSASSTSSVVVIVGLCFQYMREIPYIFIVSSSLQRYSFGSVLRKGMQVRSRVERRLYR